MTRPVLTLLTVLLTASPRLATAQAELQGRVLTDGARRPIPGAKVAIPTLGITATVDSLGRYRLERIPSGEHLVVTRAVGYRPDSTTVQLDRNETIVSDIVLKVALNELPTVAVSAESRPAPFGYMADFEARRAQGIGTFIDRELLAKNENRRLGEVIASNAPGLRIHSGSGLKAWAATSRSASTAKCAMCPVRATEVLDKTDIADGAPLACYSDVYLNGILVYGARAGSPSPLFNLNSVQVAEIEAVEVYTSAARVPARYNKTSGGCGVILLWSRTGR